MTVTVNHIVISGEVSDDQGTVKPVHLIFKKEDLAKAPGLIQDIFSLATRYIYHQSNHPSPPRGEGQGGVEQRP